MLRKAALKRLISLIFLVGIVLVFALSFLLKSPFQAEASLSVAPAAAQLENGGQALFGQNETPTFIIDTAGSMQSQEARSATGTLEVGSSSITAMASWSGNSENIQPEIIATGEGNSDQFEVKLNKNQFRPGKYKLSVKLSSLGREQTLTQDFTWGVLAINSNKAIYAPGEMAYLQMGVVNDLGHTVCDAPLKLEIITPSSQIQTLTTTDNLIQKSGECGQDNVTDRPDYFVNFKVADSGDYQMRLTNLDNNYSITTLFKVEDSTPFEIERVSATRINPFKASYVMTLKIKAGEDLNGSIKEKVPASFEVTEISNNGTVSDPSGDLRTISWPAVMNSGDTVELAYRYQAPKISPEFYLVGPLGIHQKTIDGDNGGVVGETIIFSESHQWQIAADTGFVASKSSTWSDTTAWTTSGYPGQLGSTDTASIANWMMQVTANPPYSVASVLFTSTTGGSITVDTTKILTVSGDIKLNNTAATNTKATLAGAGTISAGSVTVGSVTATTSPATTTMVSTITALTISGSGNLAITNQRTNGSKYNTSYFQLDSGTVTVPGSVAFTKTISTVPTLTMVNTATNAGTLILSGTTPFTVTGGGAVNPVFTAYAATCGTTVNYSAAGDQTVYSATASYQNLTLSTSGAKTMTGVADVYGNFTMSGSATTTGMVVTAIGGNVDLSGTSQATLGAILTITGTLTVGSGTIWTLGAFAFTESSTSSITGTFQCPAAASCTGLKTFTNTVTVQVGGTFTLTTSDANKATTLFSAGIVQSSANLMDMSSGAAQLVGNLTGSGAGGITFGGTLAINSGTTTNSYSGGTVIVTGALTLTGGWTQGTNSTLEYQSTTTISAGNFDAGTNVNTVNYTAAGQTIKDPTGTLHTYYNLGLGGSGAKVTTSVTTVTNNFTVYGTATVATGDMAITSIGNFIVNGSTSAVVMGTGGGAVVTGNVTLACSGAGGITTAAVAFTVNGTSGISGGTLALDGNTGAKLLKGLVTVNGGTLNGTSTSGIQFENGIAQTSGTASITGAVTFQTNSQPLSGTLTFGGAVSIIGAINITNQNTSTVTITGNLDGSVSGSTWINDTNSSLLLGGSVFTTAGTLTASASPNTVTYNNTSSGQTVNAATYHHLTIAKTAQTATLGGAIILNGDLTITSGILDTSGTNYGITIAGDWSNGGTLTPNAGTVTFNKSSGTQTLNTGGVGAGKIFNNLTHSGAGTLQLINNPINIDGVFTNSSGTFDANDLDMNIADDFLISGGSFSADVSPGATTQTVTFDTTAEATVSGSSTFYNLTMNTTTDGAKTIKFTAATTQTINGTWTLDGAVGKVLTLRSTSDTNAWKFVIPADINPAGDYIDVKDSQNTTNAYRITAGANYVDAGNNVPGWLFPSANTAPTTPISLVQKKVTGGATLATGDWTGETQVQFTATASDTDNPDTLYLCVEKDLIATALSSTNGGDLCGSGVAYSGTPVTVSVTITGLTDANEYHWQVQVKDIGGLYSAFVSYDVNTENPPTNPAARDFGVDTTAPTGGTIFDGTDGTDDSYNSGSLSALSAYWTSAEPNFDVSSKAASNVYQYAIGTTAGGTDTTGGWAATGTSGTDSFIDATGLTLRTGQTYYFSVKATDAAGNTSSAITSNGIAVAPTLTFSYFSGGTITFDELNSGNSWTDSAKTTVLRTSTNAYGGYVIKARALDELRHTGDITKFIAHFRDGGLVLNSAPETWTGIGFGYTTNDDDLSGGTANRFTSGGPKYAGWVETGPGDPVADHTATVNGSPISNEDFTITYRVTSDATTSAGKYQTTIIYTCIPQY